MTFNLTFLLFVVILQCCVGETFQSVVSAAEGQRSMLFHESPGGSCAYMAAWLVSVNLYRKVAFYLDIARAEAASTEVEKTTPHKYMLLNDSEYYVHHMSNYEHLNHKAYGFPAAEDKTALMSRAAVRGECAALKGGGTSSSSSDKRNEYIAFVPFYSGRPSNGSQYWTDGLGHGNSIVNSTIKAQQGMATICSCLQYFGFVFVGVSSTKDRILLMDMLRGNDGSQEGLLPHRMRKRVGIIQFDVQEPVFAIFHLLVWGQHYIKMHNCHQFTEKYQQHEIRDSIERQRRQKLEQHGAGQERGWGMPNRRLSAASSDGSHSGTHGSSSDVNGGYEARKKGWWKGKLKKYLFADNMLVNMNYSAVKEKSDYQLYDICMPKSIQQSYYALSQINVTYISWGRAHWNVHQQQQQYHQQHQYQKEYRVGFDVRQHAQFTPVHTHSIRYVYFSEGDQILRFSSMNTMHALSAASNSSTFFHGQRKHKRLDSTPHEYMKDLSNECPSPKAEDVREKLFVLEPDSTHLQKINKSAYDKFSGK